jgi:hypothetical protein
VLPPPAAVLDTDARETPGVGPAAQLGRGGGQVGPVAEDVAEAVAPPDAQARGVGAGDVVVEVDRGALRAAPAGSAPGAGLRSAGASILATPLSGAVAGK